MHFEARIAPLNGKLPKVAYRWDPETDILTVACKGGPKGSGMNGTVDLEGGDGSFVITMSPEWTADRMMSVPTRPISSARNAARHGSYPWPMV